MAPTTSAVSSQIPPITSSQTAPPLPSMAPSSHLPPQPIPPIGGGGGNVAASNGGTGTAPPTYNPFPPPSMGAYSPFGMPYFRPPHMMPGPGGVPPPHAFGPLPPTAPGAPPPHAGPPGSTIGPSPVVAGPRPSQPPLPSSGSGQPQGQSSSFAVLLVLWSFISKPL